MSFDRGTNRLWIADVGWELWESVFCAKPAMNGGWSWMEGPNPVHPNGRHGPTPVTPPTIALSHAESMSVTGGFVYRGKRFPELVGHYVFGDWDTRRLFAAKLIGQGDQVEPHRTIGKTDQRIVSFAEDADGELLVLDNEGGGIFELARRTPPADARPFPRKLSDTGLFADVVKQTPAPGVYPYSIKAPQWADGATAEHWIAVPGVEKVGWPTYEVFGRLTQLFPKDSVLVRTFSIVTRAGQPPRKLETQLMHFDGRQWQGYGYRWREDGSDAELVAEAGDRVKLIVEDATLPGGKREQTWHYASRAQCLTCHNIHAGYVVGYHEPQLDVRRGGASQLADLRQLGLAPQPYEKKPGSPAPPTPFTLVDPHDPGAPLAERARSYLHANCAHCHREHGGGTALIDLRKERSDKDLRAIDATPILGTFGLDDGKLITPGDPARSVLLYRMAKTGSGRMPHVGSAVPDSAGVALVGNWIGVLEGTNTARGKADEKAALRAIGYFAADPATYGAELDKLIATPNGALSVVHALDDGVSGSLSAARPKAIGRALAALSNLPPASRDLFERFTGRHPAAGPKLGAKFDRAALLATPGDVARGRDVFVNVAQCAACHVAGDVKGREFGPDLSKIATKYAKAELLEQIAEPSKVIAEGFTVYDVETADGESITGLLVSRTADEVTLKDPTLQVIRLKGGDVKSMRPQALSSMPPGLLDNLEPQQAADLLAWLATLQ
jgi:putative heme-binding domain-containing protein